MGNPTKFDLLKSVVLSHPKIISRTILGVLISISAFALVQRYSFLKAVETHEASNALERVSNSIDRTMSKGFQASVTLALTVNDDGQPVGFEESGKQLVDNSHFVDGIQLVPNGVIKYVYPVEKNKSVLDYDILQDSLVNREAIRAIETREYTVAGPIHLKQGGFAVVGRLPIYRRNKFWGFSAVLISFETIIRQAEIDSTGQFERYFFQFSKVDPNTQQHQDFLPSRIKPGLHFVESRHFELGSWDVSVGVSDSSFLLQEITVLGLLGLLISLTLSSLLYRVLSRPAVLAQLVVERTEKSALSNAEVEESEKKYRALVENISDAFVALDNNWNYVFVNKKAAEIAGCTPNYLIGKNIWEEFPAIKEETRFVYDGYHQAAKDKKSVTLENYYAPYDKWFESNIYPSLEGVSIFFKDVTERKESEKQIKNLQLRMDAAIRVGQLGYWDLDLITGEILWSDSVFEMFEIPKETVLNFEAIRARVHPEDLEFFDKSVAERLDNKVRLPFEYRTILLNGAFCHIQVNFESVLNELDEPVKLHGTVVDITRRKNVEIELNLALNAKEEAEEVAGLGHWEYDLINGTYRWSKQMYKHFGFERTDFFPSSDEANAKIHPDDVEVLHQSFASAAEGILPENKIFRTNPAVLPLRYFLPNWSIKKDDSGRVTKIFGTTLDVTEQQTEKLEKERFYNVLEESLNEIYILNFRTFQFEYINKGALSNLGYSFQELQGRTPSVIAPRRSEQSFHELVAPLVNKETEKLVFNSVHQRADGTQYPVEVHLQLVDSDGKSVFLGIVVDTTERKQAEQDLIESEILFRTLTSSAPVAIFQADLNKLCTFVNEEWFKISGKPLDETLGLSWLEGIHPMDQSRVLREWLRTDPLDDVFGSEFRYLTKDGRTIWLATRVVKLLDADLKHVGYIGMATDITDVRMAHESVRKYNSQLQDLASHLLSIRENERTRIAQEIHDELGQQLTVIKLSVHFLLKSQNGSNSDSTSLVADLYESINKSIDTVRKIASDLHPVILERDGLRSALDLQSTEFERKTGISCSLEFDVSPMDMDTEVSTQIYRIYQESLTNVARHSGASMVKAKFRQKASKYHMTIVDNGKGFNSEDNSQKSLGLILMRERASGIGGELSIYSQPGKGTAISLIIPVPN